MPAMSSNLLHEITNIIRQMADAEKSHINFHTVADDIVKQVLPAEVYNAFHIIRGYVAHNGYQRFYVRYPTCKLELYGNSNYPTIQSVEYLDAVPDGADEFVESRLDVAKKFGRIQAVVEYLNDVCSNVNQVAFYFPGIITLMERCGPKREKAAEKLRAGSLPTSFPNVPPIVRAAIKKASTDLTLTILADIKYKSESRQFGLLAGSISEVNLTSLWGDEDVSWSPTKGKVSI
jgi:hypothetical protein